MLLPSAKFKSVDHYIDYFPKQQKDALQEIRKAIQQAAPKAEEVLSYNMPAYKLNGMLVYFAGFKNHVSLFPTSSGIAAFKKELAAYEGSKGTVRFPLGSSLPLNLIRKIVKYRVKENETKHSGKKK